MNARITGICFSALLVSLPAAANAAPAAAVDTPAIVLKAAHLFDGRSGQLQSPGLVVVKNDRIVAVGRAASIPAGSRTIDLGDAT